MTFIEFFDRTASENICASLLNVPDRIVLIGDKLKVLEKHSERYKELFLSRGYDVEFIPRTVNRNSLDDIVGLFSELVDEFDDCIFDLTGGEDLLLVAIGIVSERYKHKNIKMHRVNIRSNTVIYKDNDGTETFESSELYMDCDENIKIYGGDIVYDTGLINGGTYVWEMDDEFCTDIRSMWSICRKNVKAWNKLVNMLELADEAGEIKNNGLTVTVNIALLREVVERRDRKYYFDKEIASELYDCGVVTDFRNNGEYINITYKNKQVKKCLNKAGLVLEMYLYVVALSCTDSSGNYVYNDVRTGVYIDWDGELHGADPDVFDTKNEIDLILMHGIVPIFVSCKNGEVEMEELYKLNSVAERFGGRYAKKVVVATALDKAGDFGEYFRQRAEDMNIRLISDLQNMSEDEVYKTVKKLWCT